MGVSNIVLRNRGGMLHGGGRGGRVFRKFTVFGTP